MKSWQPQQAPFGLLVLAWDDLCKLCLPRRLFSIPGYTDRDNGDLFLVWHVPFQRLQGLDSCSLGSRPACIEQTEDAPAPTSLIVAFRRLCRRPWRGVAEIFRCFWIQPRSRSDHQ